MHPLDVNVDVKFSTQFYDTKEYNRTSFYSTRSKNRGYVLIINNINFSQGHDERHGAEADERNLRQLFEKMGLNVTSYTDLDAYDMYFKTKEFSEKVSPTQPDMAIVIIMSHGLVINNETMIVSSDNKFVAEESFKLIFNNENCALFRKKPKIFIYHICRNVLKESVTRETFTDAILSNSLRTYSDMLICHPSVKGKYTFLCYFLKIMFVKVFQLIETVLKARGIYKYYVKFLWNTLMTWILNLCSGKLMKSWKLCLPCLG